MHYEVCDCLNHIKPRCLMFRVAKLPVTPCGYVVVGLGFFYIPHDGSVKQKTDARVSLIRVMEGNLAVNEVVSELEWLIPGDWSWKVEDAGHNLFRTIFPSKNELLRTVEWGVVQSKFNKSKFQIEERLVDTEVKYILPKLFAGHGDRSLISYCNVSMWSLVKACMS
jgi:hypothetical protein